MKKRKSNQKNRKKYTYLFPVISLLILLAVILFRVPGKEINTKDAYGFNIFLSKGINARQYNELRSANEVKTLSQELSGKYRGKRWASDLSKIKRDETLVVIPVYPDEFGNPNDYTYSLSYGMFDSDDEIFTDLGFYIIDSKTIAVWDNEKEKFWIGSKKKGLLDLSHIKSLLKVKAAEEDIARLEGEPID